MWRVAIYAREAPGRAGRARLDRQVAGAADRVARQPGWRHVATYVDQDLGRGCPGLTQLLADARSHFDLLVVADGYGRLSPDHRELQALLSQLGGAGVRVVVFRPAAGRRFGRLVANLALADLVGAAAR
jgi:DNA invertase Pin-like site-specific DNA recombinase